MGTNVENGLPSLVAVQDQAPLLTRPPAWQLDISAIIRSDKHAGPSLQPRLWNELLDATYPSYAGLRVSKCLR